MMATELRSFGSRGCGVWAMWRCSASLSFLIIRSFYLCCPPTPMRADKLLDPQPSAAFS